MAVENYFTQSINMPVGISSFEKIRKNNAYYVDKTGLVEELILAEADVTLFTRPRRFGKSYAANMLAAYYSKGADSEKMFSDLKIADRMSFRENLNSKKNKRASVFDREVRKNRNIVIL